MDTNKALTHLTGENIQFIEQLYAQYTQDPNSVDASWLPVFAELFEGGDPAGPPTPSFSPRSIFRSGGSSANGHSPDEHASFEDKLDGTQVHAPGKSRGFAASVETLVRAYRLHGHARAQIDPLGRPRSTSLPELLPETYGLSEADMNAPLRYEALFGDRETTLREVIDRLRDLYCGHIGVEYQYISEPTMRSWLRRAIERNNYAELTDGERVGIYQGLVDADGFESFLQKKYGSVKRFSLSGGDALIPMMRAMFDEAGALGVREILLGMAHRGRLNVLHNIMGKEDAMMFSEFEKTTTPEAYIGSSDVKYHMGYSSEYALAGTDETIHLSMAFNPSHLEFVNPVVVGRARAKQDRTGRDDAKRLIMPFLLHGDAAFSGQGVVPETFNLSKLDAYDVGGTIHVVINNQVGFTTNPEDGRSTRYATDIAKMLEIPILHVNGDDPEACARAGKLAIQYRQAFGRDVVIDLVCYRLYGHNEGDEPRFTQPDMYQTISDLKRVRVQYAEKIAASGLLTQDEVDRRWKSRLDGYEPAYAQIKQTPKPKHVNTLGGLWSNYTGGPLASVEEPDTTIDLAELQRLGAAISTLPEDFKAHRTIARIIRTRGAMARGEQPVDWGMAENLAYATLVDKGVSVRMTGQDCIRGTFSHRHAAVFHNDTAERYWPMRHLNADQGRFEIYNSSLSETGVLGFEYGYSLDSPDGLTIWEAQFGDFVNGAQVIIDQFINSGEDKWKRLSGLVMLLPHGYEGQGPEHSSARLERFLQLCAEDNMFVMNLTTAAQIFHALRRQILIRTRKPLIVMSPKSLLRLDKARSTLDELANGSFQHVIPETRPEVDPEQVDRVLLCSGKVYYDLIAYAEAHNLTKSAVVRVEQLYPLHREALEQAVAPYTRTKKVVWVQEEPKNMGAWYTIFPELLEIFGGRFKPLCISRAPSASPATGDGESHRLEQENLVRAAFEYQA